MIAGNTNECVAAMICSISLAISFPDVTPVFSETTGSASEASGHGVLGLRFANGLYGVQQALHAPFFPRNVEYMRK